MSVEDDHSRPGQWVGVLSSLATQQTGFPLFREGGEADLVAAGDGDYASELKRPGKKANRR